MAALAIFSGIILVKVTNPIHGQYFTAEVATHPFVHLGVQQGAIHWLVMGMAYALAAVGLFMLFELFINVSYDTKPLIAVVGLTGLPVTLDIAGAVTPYLLEITYSSLVWPRLPWALVMCT